MEMVDNKNAQPQQKPKAVKQKNLELALRAISRQEFLSQLEVLKQTYPGSELLWLRGIANYLNSILPFDCDPTFTGKSIDYPGYLLNKDLKKAMTEFLEQMGEPNVSYFYHILMTIMCVEMSKNSSVVGFKLLLQSIGRKWPKICCNEMAKTALLRNSYQNRSNICLSIFWAVAQGGYAELQVGINVWQNLMLANLEMKSYTRFIVEYFEKILKRAQDKRINMDQQAFLDIYNILQTHRTNISKDCQESLRRSSVLFLQTYKSSSRKHANIFFGLFRKIRDSRQDSTGQDGCISCRLKVADLLAKEMEHNKESSPHLEALKESLKSAQQTASQNKKKQSGTDEKKCGCCKWVFGSFVLIALIAGALTYDTNVNGRGIFAQSATGRALKNAGLLPHVEKAWYVSMSSAARGYKWAEVNVPPYAKPFGELCCNLYKLSRNAACNAFTSTSSYISSKLPVVAAFLEQYVPGLPGHIEKFYTSAKELVLTGFKAGLEIWNGIEFGPLSCENLARMANNTRNAALDYYYTFHKKVDAYAKLK